MEHVFGKECCVILPHCGVQTEKMDYIILIVIKTKRDVVNLFWTTVMLRDNMAQRKGLVIRIEKNGWAQVATERKGSCDGCGPGHNCHSCLSSSKIVTPVLNKAGAKTGDLVTVSLDSDMILKNAAVLYLIPIVGLVASAVLGAGLSVDWGISETGAAIGFGGAGLCLGFLIAVFISKRMSADNRLTPTISRIIQPGAEYSPLSQNIHPGNKKNMCVGCH